ncbi:N-acetyltransferase [Paenibacillus albiflavus]|uniref:N-acetyltransferase n=1 Tax=Paenibacillus albiflavus TaxID=2545760 RepID=A0A4V2WPP2_9BACL|nr:GNAT family protein [Paenibacillus albiflavus]TCZ80152.1 N-acetyltransferase [Paenibacillus albiflavus]
MTFPELQTARLDLIEIKQEHAPELFCIHSNELVCRYYGKDPMQKLSQAQGMVDLFNKSYTERRAIRWGIVIKETQEFIGTLGLNNLQEHNKRAEIGYELHPDYWRQGYVSEAVREVMTYSYEMLDLYRIGAVTFPDNEASNQLLIKLGFEREGTLRGYLYQNGASHDANIYSRLRDASIIAKP